MTALEILEKTRSLIEKPENWTQDVGARNALGEETYFEASDATCWCLTASIYKIGSALEPPKQPVRDAINVLEQAIDSKDFPLSHGEDEFSVQWFNDNHTHDDILATLDKAIELAKGKLA